MVLRWPVVTTSLVLSLLTLLAVRFAWDTTAGGAFAGSLILAELYFFPIAAFVGMLYVAASAARGVCLARFPASVDGRIARRVPSVNGRPWCSERRSANARSAEMSVAT